jgi:hypothetical protein
MHFKKKRYTSLTWRESGDTLKELVDDGGGKVEMVRVRREVAPRYFFLEMLSVFVLLSVLS